MNGLRTYRPMKRASSFGSLGKPKPKVRSYGIPKRLGESAIDKGPWRNEAHLARVKAQPCIVCGKRGVDGHHCRKILERQLLPRDDRLLVPVCREDHDAITFRLNEREFWAERDNPHIEFIRSFSPEGRAFLAEKGI